MTPLPGEREQPRAGILEDEDGDDAVSAPRDGLAERTTTGAKVGATVALAALVIVGIAFALTVPPGTLIGRTSNAPSPTPSTNDSGTPLSPEDESWGSIWARADGVSVLRPTWLPKSKDEYQIGLDTGTSRDRFFEYHVTYVELHPSFGRTVWYLEFSADSLDGPGRAVQEFGGTAQDAEARGHAAELFGNGSPGWTLAWNEGNYRYAIQAFGVSREDLLHITDSLAPVVDKTGRTTRPR